MEFNNPYQRRPRRISRQCLFVSTNTTDTLNSGQQCEQQATSANGYCRRHAPLQSRRLATRSTLTRISEFRLGQMSARNLEIIPLVSTHRSLGQVECEHCHALMWIEERKNGSSLIRPVFEKCCKAGKLSTIQRYPNLPPEIGNLLQNTTQQSMLFKTHIRAFNTNLSFGTVSTISNPTIIPNQHNIYCYSVAGNVHFSLVDITTTPHHARFGGIYFFSPQEQTDIRLSMMPNLRQNEMFLSLLTLISRINPYTALYGSISERVVEDGLLEDEYQLRLSNLTSNNTAPTVQEVGAMVTSTDAFQNRDVVVPILEGVPSYQRFSIASPLTDPLCYTALFPYGTPGWSDGLRIRNGTDITNVSACDFYR